MDDLHLSANMVSISVAIPLTFCSISALNSAKVALDPKKACKIAKKTTFIIYILLEGRSFTIYIPHIGLFGWRNSPPKNPPFQPSSPTFRIPRARGRRRGWNTLLEECAFFLGKLYSWHHVLPFDNFHKYGKIYVIKSYFIVHALVEVRIFLECWVVLLHFRVWVGIRIRVRVFQLFFRFILSCSFQCVPISFGIYVFINKSTDDQGHKHDHCHHYPHKCSDCQPAALVIPCFYRRLKNCWSCLSTRSNSSRTVAITNPTSITSSQIFNLAVGETTQLTRRISNEFTYNLLLWHPILYLVILHINARNTQDKPNSVFLKVNWHGNSHQLSESECIFVGFCPHWAADRNTFWNVRVVIPHGCS